MILTVLLALLGFGRRRPAPVDEPLPPDAPVDLELRLRTTELYWLLVRSAQHARHLDDDEDAARAVMAEIELNAATAGAR